MKTTKNGKAIAPVVDIFPQLCLGFHDDARIDEEMRLLESLGFERVYFVLCNPGYPMFSNPMLCIQPPNQASENYSFKSIVSLGDPNFAYLHHCHHHGMEAFAVIKPYECGGGSTVPHGAKLPLSPAKVETVGGDRIGFDNLIGKKPHLRIKRKPIRDYEKKVSQSVTKITASFCLDELPEVDYKGTAEEKFENNGNDFLLYTSRDNGSYSPVEEKLNISEKIELLNLNDPNGVELPGGPRHCLTVEINDLNFDKDIRYFALLIRCGEKMFTIPQSMIKIYGPDGEIPSTVSMHIRHGGNPVENAKSVSERNWGMEQHPKMSFDPDEAVNAFTEWGFEHEWLGTGFGSVWKDCAVYGIAKGKLEYMKGTPCEACGEVRAYWLDWIDKCIEMGFDGIDLRLQNHSGMVSDYFSFGYNDEIVERYKEKFNADILKDEAEPLKIMETRGEFFTEFIEKASEKIHKENRKLQVHLRHCHEKPELSHLLNELGFWAMPKIWLKDWKKIIDLSDEMTLKDYHSNKYDPDKASKIKEYAGGQDKRVWVHCYVGQGKELNHDFFSDVENDAAAGGILLYEAAHSFKNEVNLGLIEQYGPVGFYEPVAGTLKTLLKEFNYS